LESIPLADEIESSDSMPPKHENLVDLKSKISDLKSRSQISKEESEIFDLRSEIYEAHALQQSASLY